MVAAAECVRETKIDQNPSRRSCASSIICVNQTFYQSLSMISSSIKWVPKQSIMVYSIEYLNLLFKMIDRLRPTLESSF